MSNAQRAILVIHPGGLGDVLLAVPALHALRKHYPHHRLILLAGSDVGNLLQACGIIDQVLPLEGADFAALYAGENAVSHRLAMILQSCDVAIGWLKDHEGTLERTCQQFDIPQVIIEAPDARTERHQADRFLGTFQNHVGGEAVGSLTLRIHARRVSPDRIDEGMSPTIVCHVGSGSRYKCVQPHVLREIIERCRSLEYLPVVVAGPADASMVEALGDGINQTAPLIYPEDIVELATLLAKADGFIGHDSGVTHLAALMGCPTVAMFGPTDASRWAPRGGHVAVVRGEVCRCQGWPEVQRCSDKPCLPVHAGPVVDALRGLLERYREVTKT